MHCLSLNFNWSTSCPPFVTTALQATFWLPILFDVNPRTLFIGGYWNFILWFARTQIDEVWKHKIKKSKNHNWENENLENEKWQEEYHNRRQRRASHVVNGWDGKKAASTNTVAVEVWGRPFVTVKRGDTTEPIKIEGFQQNWFISMGLQRS